MTEDHRAQLNEVRVLMGFVRTVIDSDTLRSVPLQHLLRDIDAIPDRFAAVLAADHQVVRRRDERPRRESRARRNHLATSDRHHAIDSAPTTAHVEQVTRRAPRFAPPDSNATAPTTGGSDGR